MHHRCMFLFAAGDAFTFVSFKSCISRHFMMNELLLQSNVNVFICYLKKREN